MSISLTPPFSSCRVELEVTTMLVSHEILYEQLGENSTSPRDPVAVWQGQVDLTTTVTCCLSCDNDMLVPKDRYSVETVLLPSWLSPEEWLRNTTAWKWIWGLGADPSWPEVWQRGLVGLGSTAMRLGAVKLLGTKKFRSEFRKSLRDQLVAWLETKPEDRGYGSPFSPRQWDCVVNSYVVREARQRDAGLYNARWTLGAPAPQEG